MVDIPPSAHPSDRVAVTRLTVSDFRCYAAARLEPDTRPVVLAGPNGAGKTNLLEAVSFLVPGRGLRGAKLSEAGRRDPGWDADRPGRPWAVAARLATPGGVVEVGTGLEIQPNGGERRVARIDGQTARSQAALAEHLSAVWLTPRMDRLFQEAASGRRRFLDRLVFGFEPAHGGRITAFEHAVRERARLLRETPPARWDAAWLSALEETIAAKGVAVATARTEMAARLDAACRAASGAFPRAGVAMEGTVDDWLAEAPALEVEDRLRAALARSRRRDGEAGGAAVGPHRSDLRVIHLGRGVPAAQCSTGEQKAMLIAIVLADARLQAAERGAPPLLLLDEVAAHLDGERRAALFDEICALGAQAWLTGTEATLFAPLGERAQFFRVAEARVHPMEPPGP